VQTQLAEKYAEGVGMVEILKEQIYVIPLRDVKKAPRWKRAPRAIKDIRTYLQKHMKSDDVKLDSSINEKVWDKGSEKPPRKIRIRAMKFEDGQVQAELAEE
jgi:large subunit ribosomal protein L31e